MPLVTVGERQQTREVWEYSSESRSPTERKAGTLGELKAQSSSIQRETMLHDWSVLTVRRAEESVGVRFLCAGNGIAAAPYQRWPHRPRAFDAAAK